MVTASETDLLKLLFNNTTWAALGDATGIVGSTGVGSFFIALHTSDPLVGGNQSTNEAAYTNYARVAVARSTAGWTVGTNTVSNAAAVTFPTCGVTGATITHFSIGKVTSGATEIIAYSTCSLVISNNITPSFAIGALVVTAS